MKVVHNEGAQWRVDLGIKGNRGFAGILGLNIQQSTVFDDIGGQFRPLTQSTVRKGLFLGKKVNGAYDWNTHPAQWQGSIKQERSQPIALQDGDMSGLRSEDHTSELQSLMPISYAVYCLKKKKQT